MIWVDGRIVADDALKVSALDRTFEHGLGLFETLRTYRGRATLLERHLARLTRSAEELGLPINEVRLPDQDAVTVLLDTEHSDPDSVLRITLTGGLGPSSGATLWMRASLLPPPPRREGAVVDSGTWWVRPDDVLARHKSLNYWSRRRAYENAQKMGFDEVLSLGDHSGWTVWEGSRTNVFAVEGRSLWTPSLQGPLVPGIMRRLVLEQAVSLGLTVEKRKAMRFATLAEADEVFLTNSVRGIIPVARLAAPGGAFVCDRKPAPGDWTQRLTILVNDWLESGGTAK